MNDIYIYIIFFVGLFVAMAIYFKFADKYNIIDKPNARSSHTSITFRGGGIIFPIAVLIYVPLFGFGHTWFLAGLVLISVISLLDDINELNGNIRMGFQFIAISFLMVDLQLFHYSFYIYLPILIFAVAMLNAWNFMDGINGITGGYSLLTVLTLIYINEQVVEFSATPFMVVVALSLIVFNFYNFRTRSKCFAGDIGSIGIAFILIFLMAQLLVVSGNFNYILLIVWYGLDATTTVFFRALKKENIMMPHRFHLYQYLANERGLPHLSTTSIYIFAQFLMNLLVISLAFTSTTIFIVILLTSALLFIAIRFGLEGSSRLLDRPELPTN